MVTSRPLRLIQVGLGGFGWHWLQTALKSKSYKLIALVDTRSEALSRANELAQLPGDRLFHSLPAALKSVTGDVLLNVTSAAAHLETTEQALRAGMHVLVEKPMSDSLANARRMVKAAARAKRLLMVTQQYRYSPLPRAIRAAIEAGKIGTLDHVIVEYQAPVQVSGWRREMDHPFLLDMAIHHFDLMRYLIGCNAKEVYAKAWNPAISVAKSAMNAICVFEMNNSVRVSYAGGWAVPGRSTGWNGVWVITGSEGSIVWNQDGATLTHQNLADRRPGLKPPTPKPLRPAVMKHEWSDYDLAHFAECIRDNREPETSGRDNLGTLAMVFAAIQSAAARKPVKVADG